MTNDARFWIDEQRGVFNLRTDGQKYAAQFACPLSTVEPNTEYALRLNLVLREGRIRIAAKDVDSQKTLNSTVVDLDPTKDAAGQTAQNISLGFVGGGVAELIISNEAPSSGGSLLEINSIATNELGAARNGWTLPFRFVVANLQKIYTLPILLPLELIGIGVLLWRLQRRTLFILLLVPLYYFCVQSFLHTEYRYVLIIHYFLFVLASVAITAVFGGAQRWLFDRKEFPAKPQRGKAKAFGKHQRLRL